VSSLIVKSVDIFAGCSAGCSARLPCKITRKRFKFRSRSPGTRWREFWFEKNSPVSSILVGLGAHQKDGNLFSYFHQQTNTRTLVLSISTPSNQNDIRFLRVNQNEDQIQRQLLAFLQAAQKIFFAPFVFKDYRTVPYHARGECLFAG
jgi:hypothetical protein